MQIASQNNDDVNPNENDIWQMQRFKGSQIENFWILKILITK